MVGPLQMTPFLSPHVYVLYVPVLTKWLTIILTVLSFASPLHAIMLFRALALLSGDGAADIGTTPQKLLFVFIPTSSHVCLYTLSFV
jgi:hypothetical protein